MGKYKVFLVLLNWFCLVGMISALTLIPNMWGFVVYSLGYILSMFILNDGDSP